MLRLQFAVVGWVLLGGVAYAAGFKDTPQPLEVESAVVVGVFGLERDPSSSAITFWQARNDGAIRFCHLEKGMHGFVVLADKEIGGFYCSPWRRPMEELPLAE